MILQCRDQYLARQRQIARIELTRERHRPFHQCRDFVEQLIGNDGAAIQRCGQRLDLAAYLGSPTRECRAYLAPALERGGIGGRRVNADRGRRHEAMPET